MNTNMVIAVICIFSFSCFIATSLIYSYFFLYENSNVTLLFPESPSIRVIADDNQSNFWHPWKGTILSDDPNIKVRGLNSLMINVNVRPYGRLFDCSFELTQNWSDKTFFSFYLYGQARNNKFRIHILTPDWNNRAWFDFYDDFKGWRKLLLPLRKPTGIVGNYDLSKVKGIIWTIPNVRVTGTWYIDRVAVEEETVWSKLLANLKETMEILIYSSAIALAISGIIVQRIQKSPCHENASKG